jgi:hypothetical protein
VPFTHRYPTYYSLDGNDVNMFLVRAAGSLARLDIGRGKRDVPCDWLTCASL